MKPATGRPAARRISRSLHLGHVPPPPPPRSALRGRGSSRVGLQAALRHGGPGVKALLMRRAPPLPAPRRAGSRRGGGAAGRAGRGIARRTTWRSRPPSSNHSPRSAPRPGRRPPRGAAGHGLHQGASPQGARGGPRCPPLDGAAGPTEGPRRSPSDRRRSARTLRRSPGRREGDVLAGRQGVAGAGSTLVVVGAADDPQRQCPASAASNEDASTPLCGRSRPTNRTPAGAAPSAGR